jgi:hypothetical protein
MQAEDGPYSAMPMASKAWIRLKMLEKFGTVAFRLYLTNIV